LGGRQGIDSVGACSRIKIEEYPWITLLDEDWFKLQRCLGNEDGFIRGGNLPLAVWEWGMVACRPFKGVIGIIGVCLPPESRLSWLSVNENRCSHISPFHFLYYSEW
jgi:hypothetical protein